MKLQKLAKDATSKTGNCPAVYVDVDDPTTAVVQGQNLNRSATAQLDDRAADESGVRVPMETLVRAIQRYLAEHGEPR